MEIKITEDAVKEAIVVYFNFLNTRDLTLQCLHTSMWAAIRARHPECASGEWEIDINTMTVKPMENEYKAEILKP